MRTAQKKEHDIKQYYQDRQAYNYWFRKRFGVADDEDYAQKIADVIYKAVEYEISGKQRQYFCEYYFDGLTMRE